VVERRQRERPRDLERAVRLASDPGGACPVWQSVRRYGYIAGDLKVQQRARGEAGIDLVVDQPEQLGDRAPRRRGAEVGLVGDAVLVVAEDVGDVREQLDQHDAEVALAAIAPVRQ